MAILNNLANIRYNSGSLTDVAVSNLVSTTLAENYNLVAEKSTYNTDWRPSENLTFAIRVENNGVEPIFNISIQDDLGGSPNRLLSYIAGSLKMLKNDVLTGVAPTSTDPLTITIPETLQPGEVVIISYVAKVKNDIDRTITEITNSAVVVGHETSESGTPITVSPNPSTTIPKANYAEVRIEKNVDKENVSVGEELTYTFRLENSGNIEATGVVITDNLPEKFDITSITSQTNGVQTVFEEGDYSVDTENKLILPTSVTKTLSVPASTPTGYGVTIVTIIGTITA